ncbi:hypothetical protein [Glaciecola petra]|uniref:Type II secretion system protein GspC N-terminal domain-containing protein n=1 Tax=Glaciecola petra TaxID=3075602 RepID=A0ABU2ZV58_9ALTE|nr:hypothetical protein [Aestuariibacter sp. P117]MDT0595474.1 hypothetical protein [Aestuariibacter sp. P117]
MKKILNNPFFVAALAICALAYVGYMLVPLFLDDEITGDGYYVPEDIEDPMALSESTSDAVSRIDTQSIQIDWFTQPIRDPFTTFTAETLDFHNGDESHSSQESALTQVIEFPELSAIIINKNNRLAMFDRKIYSVGDNVKSFKIISIEPDYVEISGEVGSKRLMLKNQIGE